MLDAGGRRELGRALSALGARPMWIQASQRSGAEGGRGGAEAGGRGEGDGAQAGERG